MNQKKSQTQNDKKGDLHYIPYNAYFVSIALDDFYTQKCERNEIRAGWCVICSY